MRLSSWIQSLWEDWPPRDHDGEGGEFRLAALPYIQPAVVEACRLLDTAARSSGLQLHPHVAASRVLTALGNPRQRPGRLRLLNGLTFDAVAFDQTTLLPHFAVSFDELGFPHGKRARQKRVRRVLLGSGLGLIRWPLQLPATERLAQSLLRQGRENPDLIAPLCPRCGTAALLRVSRQADSRFWGCSRWPECAWTSPA